MKIYELTYIVSPEITSEEAEAKSKEIKFVISTREGAILKQSNPVAKTLSYPIKKRASGFFGILEFQIEPEKLTEIKEILEKDGKIVRHMVIIKKPAKPKRERRAKTKLIPAFEIEQKTEIVTKKGKSFFSKSSEDKEKVELKDIEQKLDELLGE